MSDNSKEVKIDTPFDRPENRVTREVTTEVNQGMATLYAKLARVMGKIDPIEKGGENTHFKYKYQTAGAIANAVRIALASENVAFLVDMVSIDQSVAGITKAVFNFTFACGDSGATLTRRFEGEAIDKQDKGINKVVTAATKYFLMKTFLISSPDEPDTDSENNERPTQKATPPQEPETVGSNPDTNLKQIAEWSGFMYDHPKHAENSIRKMFEVGEISPDDSIRGAMWKVLEHQALSKPYNMPMPKVYEALTAAMTAEGSNVPVGSIKQWVTDGKTIEQAWEAIVAYHENANLEPAQAGKKAKDAPEAPAETKQVPF